MYHSLASIHALIFIFDGHLSVSVMVYVRVLKL